MTQQIVVEGKDLFLFSSKGPLPFYKFFCVECGKKGTTYDRDFQCHPGRTRITVCDEVPE